MTGACGETDICPTCKQPFPKLKNHTCAKCGYQWTSKVENPKRCPFCGHWAKSKINNVLRESKLSENKKV